jgi:hypothetical protein
MPRTSELGGGSPRESQADRKRRPKALEAVPTGFLIARIADAGNVQRQERKIIRWTNFSPM